MTSIQPELVQFDPSNPKHRDAFQKLMLDGKQSPDLRFDRGSFESVPQMMMYEMSFYSIRLVEELELMSAFAIQASITKRLGRPVPPLPLMIP